MVISGSTINAANSSNGVQNTSTGTLTISGSTITGGFGGSATAVTNNSGPLTVTNCTITGGSPNGGAGIANNGVGTLTISGSTINAGNGAVAINNASTGTVIATSSTFTANAFFNAFSIANTSADIRLSGDFLDHWSGWKAVSGGKWRLGTAPTLGQTRYALAGTTDSYFTMYGADNGSFGNPIAADVRSGISYGGGNLTGTCAVPAAGSVALGVPVDAGYGTAVLTPEAVWGAASRTITGGTVDTLTNAPASVTPSDIWSHASRTITGGTVDTLTNAPSVPSAAAIASQVRTELATELARVDAAISTRLASSAYTAPANSDITAIKAKTDNLPASPAATGDIPSANITAIKAKTDLLNTDRLAQVSTVSTTGAQLAAALS